jgi:diguanylate cyclase
VNHHERVQSLAKTAFAVMAERNVPPTPENFQLFFAYAAGENPAVSKIIGDMIAGRRPFTPAVLDDLRARFFGLGDDADAVHDVGVEITTALNSVTGIIETAGRETLAYGRTLSEASGELEDQKSTGDIRKLVDGLLSATREMESRAKDLEAELQRSSREVTDLKVKLDDVRKESLTDPLTGIANRKAFDTQLAKAIENSKKSGEPVTLFMCDIDRFKKFNDTWGHQTGDHVLRLVANSISENVKGRDTVARYGGEEFAVILPNTAMDLAINLANQIRSTVQEKKLVKKSTGDVLGTITVSIGVAQVRADDVPATLISRADACLYAAKNAGRNCVITEKDPAAAAAHAA